MSRRKASVPAAKTSRLPRLLSLVLVIGIVAFGVFYYLDQRVDAGPSLVGRQIEGAEAAVKKTPSNIAVRLQLADAYLADKRPSDALKQYDEVLKADKANRSALLGRGGALMAAGDLKGASVAYHKITGASQKGEFAGADPQLQEAYYYLGSIALKQDKPKDAIKELASALRITRSDSDALYLMGVAQLKVGQTQPAVDSLNQALLFVPTGWCEPYSQLAVAYGKLAKAPQATYAKGMADFCLNKPEDAKRQLKTLIAGPVAVDALLGLATIAEAESSKPEAVTWYQKVLTVDGNNIRASSALSRLGVAPTSSPTTQGPS